MQQTLKESFSRRCCSLPFWNERVQYKYWNKFPHFITHYQITNMTQNNINSWTFWLNET